MDCRVKCSARGHSRHLFGDMADTLLVGQVETQARSSALLILIVSVRQRELRLAVRRNGRVGDERAAAVVHSFPLSRCGLV